MLVCFCWVLILCCDAVVALLQVLVCWCYYCVTRVWVACFVGVAVIVFNAVGWVFLLYCMFGLLIWFILCYILQFLVGWIWYCEFAFAGGVSCLVVVVVLVACVVDAAGFGFDGGCSLGGRICLVFCVVTWLDLLCWVLFYGGFGGLWVLVVMLLLSWLCGHLRCVVGVESRLCLLVF